MTFRKSVMPSFIEKMNPRLGLRMLIHNRVVSPNTAVRISDISTDLISPMS